MKSLLIFSPAVAVHPMEFYRAQGFKDSYQIDIKIDGKRITKTDQVRCCGNSVCPPLAKSIIEANMQSDLQNTAANFGW